MSIGARQPSSILALGTSLICTWDCDFPAQHFIRQMKTTLGTSLICNGGIATSLLGIGDRHACISLGTSLICTVGLRLWRDDEAHGVERLLGTSLICTVGLRLLPAASGSTADSRQTLGTSLICTVGLRLPWGRDEAAATATLGTPLICTVGLRPCLLVEQDDAVVALELP